MANKIPLAIADLELQLASAVSVGATSFTLSSSVDDDGNSLPAGKYCFTLDSGTSNKEYLIGQVNGTAVTSVVSVSRQGVETSGAARAHRVGAPCIVTDFATIQRVADILRGQETLDGSNPIIYDAEPTLADRKELATVGYVLDTVSGGTVAFDAQTISGNAGESVVAGNLVYFKTSDQEWYKTDADTAATVEGVQLGIALGTGSDGVAISGGVQIAGTYTTTGLTAGALYYASNTAGAIATSAGTTSRVIGIALSTTKLLIIPRNPQSLKDGQEAALAGGSTLGTPSSTNKFATQDLLANGTRTTYDYAGSPHTWTKKTGLLKVFVQCWGAGASGNVFVGSPSADEGIGGGGGGAYVERWFAASELGSTETITIGAGGAAVTSGVGNNGGDTTFGSLLTADGGYAGTSSNYRNGGNGGIVLFEATVGGQTSETSSQNAYFGGGSGARGAAAESAGSGGNSFYGGGGGGGATTAPSATSGGTSLYGGNGGAGAANSEGNATATSGSVPGGGGGGAYAGTTFTATSGAGGNGRCIVTEFFA